MGGVNKYITVMFFWMYLFLFYTCHVYENIKILKGDFKNLSITWNIHQVLLVILINISLFLYTDTVVDFLQKHLLGVSFFLILLMGRELLFKMMSLKIYNCPKILQIMTLMIVASWGIVFERVLVHDVVCMYYPFFTIASQCIFLYTPIMLMEYLKSSMSPLSYDKLDMVILAVGAVFILLVLIAIHRFKARKFMN
jgi:hypothetical protein